MSYRAVLYLLVLLSVAVGATAQDGPGAGSNGDAHASVPPGYVIGSNDVLSIVFWRDKEMSADVTVRPDGKISLPLLKDITVAGLTPEELRLRLVDAASNYLAEPNATVIVKEIHSRNVFITGNVGKPSAYPLIGNVNVLQLIATAGGLLEYADAKNIKIIRNENGRQRYLHFNYKEVVQGRNTEQNIVLKPGDTIVVP